jgi:hypothetical protein
MQTDAGVVRCRRDGGGEMEESVLWHMYTDRCRSRQMQMQERWRRSLCAGTAED